MKSVATILLILLVILFTPSFVSARSGCCSYHQGVCGCRCCDGTALSATCAPYYPSCDAQPTNAPLPSSTPWPSPTPWPTATPEATTYPTAMPTVSLPNRIVTIGTATSKVIEHLPTPTPEPQAEKIGMDAGQWLAQVVRNWLSSLFGIK